MCDLHSHNLIKPEDLTKKSKRSRLWELDLHWHCAVVGTCIAPAELRKLGKKASAPAYTGRTADYKLHSFMVNQARRSDGVGRVLNKFLDKKYARCIKAFSVAKTSDEVGALWLEAMDRGDVPGPFWATMTHPASSLELLSQVYGEVHMLSHLEGATNRADLEEVTTLKDMVSARQTEILELGKGHRKAIDKRDHLIGQLKRQVSELEVKARRSDELEALLLAERDGESVAKLEKRIENLQNRVLQEAERADAAQKRMMEMEETHKEAKLGLRNKDQRIADLEQEMIHLQSGSAFCMQEEGCEGKDADLCGRCIAYIGGQTKQAAHFRREVESKNGQFLHHDGGLHDGQAQLKAILAQADAVMFPVTCISHEATREIKRTCMKQEKPFIPLRSQGLSAFTRGLESLEGDYFEKN